MKVKFRRTALQKQYEQSAKAQKAYGAQVARKYIGRINILKQVKSRDEIMTQHPTLRCHALTGDRKGQHAIRLRDRSRLIVTFESEEIVCIEEVSKHYGD